MRTALRGKFPDHQGKYREFHRLRAVLAFHPVEKTARTLGFFLEFPGDRNREFRLPIREEKFPDPLPISEPNSLFDPVSIGNVLSFLVTYLADSESRELAGTARLISG
jgi:hypothetical protein